MIRVQIVGATGYGGLGITELLLRHPEFEIHSLLATNDVGKPISQFFPHLRGFCDLTVRDVREVPVGEGVDVVVCATPDRVGMSLAGPALAAGARLLDYSGDFRFQSAERYERYAAFHPATKGQPHANPSLLPASAYGVPELYRDRIRDARIVGNPGCFAVAMLLGLAPATAKRLIEPRSIVVDGKTGASGAGKKLSADQHFSQYNENVTAYRIGRHQHVVEVVTSLEQMLERPVGITFVPHTVPLTRGIVCTCYATLAEGASFARIHDIYAEFYRGEPFVRLTPVGGVAPGVKAVLTSNLCDLTVVTDEANNRLIVVASIDNLMKGQAGSALHNLNVMFGLPETLGLERIPLYP